MQTIPFADFEVYFKSPDRALFAAVLLRAYMDVLPTASVEKYIRCEAIEWFKRGKKVCRIVSFEDCIEVLELSANQIDYLCHASERMMAYLRGEASKSEFRNPPRARITN